MATASVSMRLSMLLAIIAVMYKRPGDDGSMNHSPLWWTNFKRCTTSHFTGSAASECLDARTVLSELLRLTDDKSNAEADKSYHDDDPGELAAWKDCCQRFCTQNPN